MTLRRRKAGRKSLASFVWKTAVILGTAAAAAAFVVGGLDKDLQVSSYRINPGAQHASLDGLTIAHVSDLHGTNPEGLLSAIETMEPDLIVCTGDIYDGIRFEHTSDFLLYLMSRIAPVYMVSGNHEHYIDKWDEKQKKIKKWGIQVLNNECAVFDYHGTPVEICGLSDPAFQRCTSKEERIQVLHDEADRLPQKQTYRICLLHPANLADEIPSANADLILSGHLHGGQVRLFGLGIFSPSNGDHVGLFPKYSGGQYQLEDSVLVVSRGLGDHMMIPRWNNPPELVKIEIRNEE